MNWQLEKVLEVAGPRLANYTGKMFVNTFLNSHQPNGITGSDSKSLQGMVKK